MNPDAFDFMSANKTNVTDDSSRSFRDQWIAFIMDLQNDICKRLESADGKAVFAEDIWEREEGHGGGGRTRTITNGNVFEKGGVNTSVVHGDVTEVMRKQLQMDGSKWFACGLSLVIHPYSPMVPTVHANWRYFELYDNDDQIVDSWFGGGSDLTPYYIFPEDGRWFHTMLKHAMDPFGSSLYPRYKQQCDEYFVNRHRDNEARGIGGVFYDHLRPSADTELKDLFAFQQSNSRALLPAYLHIVGKRKDETFGEKEKEWQEIRRGRYVEFNLLHDRGTLFGLKTKGRTESILMSLPPTVRWEYDYRPEPGSREAELLKYLKPQDWINMNV